MFVMLLIYLFFLFVKGGDRGFMQVQDKVMGLEIQRPQADPAAAVVDTKRRNRRLGFGEFQFNSLLSWKTSKRINK